MNQPEQAIPGWEAIAFSLNMNIRTAIRRKDELIQAGVIFYMIKGRPPRRQVYHFPSRLKTWTGLKSMAGENI